MLIWLDTDLFAPFDHYPRTNGHLGLAVYLYNHICITKCIVREAKTCGHKELDQFIAWKYVQEMINTRKLNYSILAGCWVDLGSLWFNLKNMWLFIISKCYLSVHLTVMHTPTTKKFK